MIKIYPLTLREKINWRLQKFISLSPKNVALQFDPKLKMNLKKSDSMHKSIIYNGFYELPLTKLLVETAKTGTTLFDVGANYGYFSLLWASARIENRVFAFEPSPENFNALRENTILNNLEGQINCYDLALSNFDGILHFKLCNETGQTGWGGITKQVATNDISVKSMTIDSFCEQNNIQQIDALKIDTEGADPLVLQGSEKMLSKKRIKYITFEINTRMRDLGIEDYGYPIKFLQSKGYKVVNFKGGYYAF